MPTFEQKFLKPGRYPIGGGQFAELSREKLRNYVEGTKRLIRSGYEPPVLLEHAPAGSAEGAPRKRSDRDRRADEVKNGVGWVKDVREEADGSLVHVLEITDSEAARKMKEGSIRFTSPELRRRFDVDGLGFEDVIAHTALTHKPRNINQTAFEESAMQFSLGDLQMSDDNDEKPEGDMKPDDAKPDEKPENPDLPADDTPSSADQQIEAILAHLNILGIGLPADTDGSNFNDRLLTALLTKEASKVQEEADKPEDDEDDDEQAVEEQSPLQFSLADAEGGKIENKLLAKVIKHSHELLSGRVDGLVKNGQISPACRDRLMGHTSAMQFSAEGDHMVAFSLPEIVDMLEQTIPPGLRLDVQLSGAGDETEEAHPGGRRFVHGTNDPTEAEAESIVDSMFGKKKSA